MSGVLRSSDVFAMQKLASRSVHGRTLLDMLFANILREYQKIPDAFTLTKLIAIIVKKNYNQQLLWIPSRIL